MDTAPEESLLICLFIKTFCSGKIVEFLDLETGNWEELSPTNYKIGRLIDVVCDPVISKFSILKLSQMDIN